MKILGIESSGNVASCAVTEANALIGEYTLNQKRTHSETLMPLIIKMLDDLGLSLDDIELIAISKGPGSYTGLRIGAAIAKALAQAKNLKIAAVPTMQALAYNIFDPNRYIVPILDAKSKRIYSGIYKWEDDKLIEVREQFAGNIDDLIKIVNDLDKDVIINGDGSFIYKDILQQEIKKNIIFSPMKFNFLNAFSINAVANQMTENGEIINYYDFHPEYLRPSQAERMSDKKCV